MKKEKSMPKAQVGEENGSQTAVVSLAFRVVSDKEGLFAHQMLMLKGDVVVEKRTGIYTLLGHAIAAADELLDGWAFNEIEQKAEDYFHNVFM
jgi:hypothetical protein